MGQSGGNLPLAENLPVRGVSQNIVSNILKNSLGFAKLQLSVFIFSKIKNAIFTFQ